MSELERQNAELRARVEQLEESEAWLGDFFENASDLIVMVAPDGRLLRCNRAWQTALGYGREETEGRSILEVIDADCLEGCRQTLSRIVRGERVERVEVKFVARDGRAIFVDGRCSAAFKDGAPQYVRGIFRDVTARIRSEAEREGLLASERDAHAAAEAEHQRLASLLEQISDGYVTLDRAWRYTFVNRSAARMLGPRAHAGAHIWTQFPEAAAQPLRQRYERALAEQTPIQFEEYYPPWQRWFLHSVYPSEEGLAVFFKDITEQKRAEAEVARERDFSAAALNSLPGVFYLYDEDFSFLRWNENFERVTGYSPAEIQQMTPLDFFIGEEKQRVAERIQEVFERGDSAIEADLAAKDGTLIPYYFTGRRTESEGRRCLLGVGIDITKRRRVEEALRRSEARLAEAQAYAGLGSWDLDPAIDRGYWSAEMYRLHGLEPAAATPSFEAFLDCVHPADQPQVLAHHQAMKESGVAPTLEYRTNPKCGPVRHLEVTFRMTRDSDSGMVRVAGTTLDVTQRRRAEDELRRSRNELRALLARLQFLREEERTRIARELHDQLGQLVTGLKMDAAWLASKLPKDDPRITGRAAAMKQLADEVIATVKRISSNLRPAELDEFGLIAALEETAQEFQERHGRRCTFECELVDIELAPEPCVALYRICQEALTNVARHAGATAVKIRLTIENDRLFLTVADNGRGIDPADIDASKSLGLIGMRERAMLIGGEFSVAGESERGTTVTVSLPLAREAGAASIADP